MTPKAASASMGRARGSRSTRFPCVWMAMTCSSAARREICSKWRTYRVEAKTKNTNGRKFVARVNELDPGTTKKIYLEARRKCRGGIHCQLRRHALRVPEPLPAYSVNARLGRQPFFHRRRT